MCKCPNDSVSCIASANNAAHEPSCTLDRNQRICGVLDVNEDQAQALFTILDQPVAVLCDINVPQET